MGRVFSVLNMINSLAMPLGMMLFGPLADFTFVGNVFIGCGIVVILLSIRKYQMNI